MFVQMMSRLRSLLKMRDKTLGFIRVNLRVGLMKPVREDRYKLLSVDSSSFRELFNGLNLRLGRFSFSFRSLGI